MATGRHPDLTPTRQRAAAVQFAYPAVTGRLTELCLDPAAADDPSADRMVLTRHPGDPVTAAPTRTPPTAWAHWAVTADTPTACETALRRLAHHLTATILPTTDTYAGLTPPPASFMPREDWPDIASRHAGAISGAPDGPASFTVGRSGP
ncbi:hypothetical protein LT493_04905 [Streptomyces tricolor]|nr:hypothetical protein [Streptomyces tricolor]